jgi:hypothetical protein
LPRRGRPDYNDAMNEYRTTKRQIDDQFPVGRFVAVEKGTIVADAESHRQLVERLIAQGKSPKDMLIVQAGVDYPKAAIIFF